MNSQKTILIIDDSDTNVRLLVNILKMYDFDTITALDGKTGIEQAKSQIPDLILLDILMPGMSGYEVCERLKADKITKEIPIIFLSALNSATDKVKAFKLGGVDYITKPFEAEELIARLNTHLNLISLQQELQQQHGFLQQVINSLEHPFYVIDTATYKIELANSFMGRSGYQPEITCHALTHQNSKPCNDKLDPCPLAQVKQTKKPAVMEHIHFDKDGTPINVEVYGFPIFDEQGNIAKMVEYSLDITQRKLAEQQLKEQNEQLKQKNEQLDSFAKKLEALQEAKLYQINQAYERFVPHQFLSLLNRDCITDIELGDQVEKEMTILFADIREFTTISETMTPQENFNLINSFLSQMEPIITEHKGFIDKYIGDGIMALFSNADEAVQTGIAMLNSLKIYNNNRQKANYQPLKIGIGINTGSLMLGIIGGENRMDSTVISDAVNTASRLESLTKTYHTSLLISAASYLKLENSTQYEIRFLDKVKAKGKSSYIKIYEVFAADDKKVQQGKLATLEQFASAVNYYQKQNFSKAQKLFEACLLENSQDQVAEFYIQRCQNFLNVNTGTNWEDIANLINWDPKFSVKNNLIDAQHQELFVKIKDLVMSIGNDETSIEVAKMIDFLKEYTVFHFKTEEQLMQQYNYTDYPAHKKEHIYFIEQVNKLEENYKTKGGRMYLTLQIQEELVDWLINHILIVDKKLGSFLAQQDML